MSQWKECVLCHETPDTVAWRRVKQGEADGKRCARCTAFVARQHCQAWVRVCSSWTDDMGLTTTKGGPCFKTQQAAVWDPYALKSRRCCDVFGVYHTCAERLTFDLAAKAYFACYACAPKLRFSRCSCRVFARYAGAPNRHLPSRVGAFPSPSCHIHSVTDWSLSSSVRRRHVICPHTFPSPIGQNLLHERRVDSLSAIESSLFRHLAVTESSHFRHVRRVSVAESAQFRHCTFTHISVRRRVVAFPSLSLRVSVGESSPCSFLSLSHPPVTGSYYGVGLPSRRTVASASPSRHTSVTESRPMSAINPRR